MADTGQPEFQRNIYNNRCRARPHRRGIIAPPQHGAFLSKLQLASTGVYSVFGIPTCSRPLLISANLTIQHQFGGQYNASRLDMWGSGAVHLMVPFSYGQLVADPSIVRHSSVYRSQPIFCQEPSYCLWAPTIGDAHGIRHAVERHNGVQLAAGGVSET